MARYLCASALNPSPAAQVRAEEIERKGGKPRRRKGKSIPKIFASLRLRVLALKVCTGVPIHKQR